MLGGFGGEGLGAGFDGDGGTAGGSSGEGGGILGGRRGGSRGGEGGLGGGDGGGTFVHAPHSMGNSVATWWRAARSGNRYVAISHEIRCPQVNPPAILSMTMTHGGGSDGGGGAGGGGGGVGGGCGGLGSHAAHSMNAAANSAGVIEGT
jgi:hypothetical protein